MGDIQSSSSFKASNFEHLSLCLDIKNDRVKIGKAVKKKQLPRNKPERLVDKALEAGVITAEEAKLCRDAEAARDDAIQVDSFDLQAFTSDLAEPSSKAALG